LLAFNAVLNNHTVAAYSAFFALDAALAIEEGAGRSARRFAAAGFFAAFCACNELPAASFGVLLFGALLWTYPVMTLRWFVPAAVIPCAAFLATQYLAVGQLVPVYAEFGTESYLYPGSYWLKPMDLDALNEPKAEYFYHMILGHHGVLSLTPIFLFSALGAVQVWRGPRPLALLARLTTLLTAVLVVFYAVKTNNYGGSTQGLRWLFWLIPFWLLLLPWGLTPIRAGDDLLTRRLSLAALFVSAVSVGYALLRPWSNPWLLDLLEHLGWYELT
jgi:hypothetical protein